MKPTTVLLVTILIISLSGFGIITLTNSTSASADKEIDKRQTTPALTDVVIASINTRLAGTNLECEIVIQNNGDNTARDIKAFILLPPETHVIRMASLSADVTFTDHDSYVLVSVPSIDPGLAGSRTIMITTDISNTEPENKFVAFVFNNLSEYKKGDLYKTADL